MADQFVQAMYRQQKDMSLGLGNTNGEEWWVCDCIQWCTVHLNIQNLYTSSRLDLLGFYVQQVIHCTMYSVHIKYSGIFQYPKCL